MILRLLFIFSLSSIGSSFKPAIELDRCKTDTSCFIRESCINRTQPTDETKLVLYNDEPLKDNTCDVILQTRPFNPKKVLIVLQVSSAEPISSDGVVLQQGIEQFRCSDGKEETKNDDLTLSLFEGSQSPNRYNLNLLFCAFTLETSDHDIRIPITSLFLVNSVYPEIIFKSGSKMNSVKYLKKNQYLWHDMTSKLTCDPGIIDPLDNVNESLVFEKIDNTRSSIACPTSETLIMKHIDGSLEYPSRIFCELNEWKYEIDDGEQTKVVTVVLIDNKQENIKVACTKQKCSLCKPLELLDCGGGCEPSLHNDTSGHCTTSSCANGLWRLSSDLPVKGEMKCEHKKGSPNDRESVWYFVSNGTEDREISKASCAKDADCMETEPKVTLQCPTVNGKELKCSGVQKTGNQDLSCRNDYQLRYKFEKDTFETSNLTCNVITGKYTDEVSQKVVPGGAQIYCEQKEANVTTSSVAAAAGFPFGTVFGSLAGIVVLVVIVVIAVVVVKFRKRMKRRRQELAANEQMKKELMRKKIEIATLAAAPNPEYVVDRKGVPDSQKTKWEKRLHQTAGDKGKKKLDKTEWDEKLCPWDDIIFQKVAGKFITEYTKDGRLSVLQHLTAFDAYNPGERKDPPAGRAPKQFGTLPQFFYLWHLCREQYFDCPDGWEYMWRFMRMLYDHFMPHDDGRRICKGMVRAVAEFARPMLNELSYKMRHLEDECDTRLRPLIVRMLLWAEAPDVIAEVTRQADLPISELQISMRPAVLQYAARQLGRAAAMKEKYWLLVEEDDVPPGHLPWQGTIRQHLLYALCSARDDSQIGGVEEFKIMKETMTAMFYSEKLDQRWASYTPLDHAWAFRGAAEFVTNHKPAVDLFLELCPRDQDEIYDKVLMSRCNHDREVANQIKLEWQMDIRDLINVVSEMCTIKKQFNDVASIVGPMALYAKKEAEANTPFAVSLLQDRAYNFYNLIADQKAADLFFVAVYPEKDEEKKKKGPKKERE